MISIGEFFKRIGGIQAREIAFRADVQKVVKETVGIDIPIECILFRSGVVTLKKVPHAARSAIFIKKDSILESINSIQAARHVSDIR
jgi:hypothetical protein